MSSAPRPLRIVLGAFGQPGHAFPMLALGERLVARGHSVWFETWERWRSHVEAAGMHFLPAAEYQVFPTRERRLNPYETARRATPGARAAVAAVAPDVVVHDILTLAPALAAELEGVPVATLVPHLYPVSQPGSPPFGLGAQPPRTSVQRAGWGLLGWPLALGLTLGRTQLNETRRALGLPPLTRLHAGLSDRLCLVATLPQLEYARAWPEHVHVVGPLMWEPPASEITLPKGDEPLVLIAPSTVQDSQQRLLRAAIDGLRRERVRVIGITNRRPLSRPLRAGSNASLVQWAPYAQTMPRCALVITHAGHGTLMRALTSGTPVLAVPRGGDMAENAARITWSGAGVRLPWRSLTPRALRAAAERILGELPSFAGPAGELAAWSAAHDGPTRAAELVEQLVS